MEKKKNDTLQDDVLYLHKRNLSYLHGDTKDLANKKEVFKNIAWQAGSGTQPDLQIRILYSGCMLLSASFLLFIGGISLFAAISLVGTEPIAIIAVMTSLFLPVCILGIWMTYYAIRHAIYRPEKIHNLYAELVHHGQSCSGYISRINYKHSSIEYSFTSPTGKRIKGSYHTNLGKSELIRKGQPVVVLYLNDKTHILL